MNLRDVVNEVEADISTGSHIALYESPFRNHLGASILGRDCIRELVYVFRWAYEPSLSPRIRRLFERGNHEEERVATWLRFAGWRVETHDPDTGEQFRVTFFEQHGGGSLDAIISHERYNWRRFLGEFKTHKDSSFSDLVKRGVIKSKPEHYAQMCVYMELYGLDYALYFAVNKDTDEIHVELIAANSTLAAKMLDRARMVISAQSLPPRISETPAFYKCKFCDFAPVCHNNEPLAKNCRSCKHAQPAPAKQWVCTRFDKNIDKELMRRGCDYWTAFE